MNNILEVSNLNKTYNDFSLKDVSFTLPKGYIMGFIGHNGAGKTTTIKAILNMISLDSGSVKIQGQNIKDDELKIKEDIGVVMDLAFYPEEWKVKEVEKAISPLYTKWNHNQFIGLLKKFNINLDKKIKDLSRGMKVKLMLASALSHGASLLILDEPTSGLDPVARDELMDILSDFITDENKGVLFSTHITSDLEKIADYITFIINGKIEFTGEKDELLESYVMVRGGTNELTVDQKKLVLGYREHSAGFEGMLKTENMRKMPKGIDSQKITLDEIIVYMNKESGKNE